MLGLSKQAYYKRNQGGEQEQLETQIILEMIKKVRHRMPRLGTRKLLHKLQPQLTLAGIEMGRDSFFDFLRLHGLLIKTRKRYCVTTFSAHWLHKYDNLLPGFEITAINQVWVSDITYLETDEGFLYLYLITDAYSRKIIGYTLSDNLKAASAVVALKMAIRHSGNGENIIHHSDRGIQYCSEEYTAILKKERMKISMSEPKSPTQNAIAERVNGILKTELISSSYEDIDKASVSIGRAIIIYNFKRRHSSLNYQIPHEVHLQKGPQIRRWKNYYNAPKRKEKTMQDT